MGKGQGEAIPPLSLLVAMLNQYSKTLPVQRRHIAGLICSLIQRP